MFIVYSSKNLEQLTDTEIYSFQFSLSNQWQHLEWSIPLVLCTVLLHVRKGDVDSQLANQRGPPSARQWQHLEWSIPAVLCTVAIHLCCKLSERGRGMWIPSKLIKEGHHRPASETPFEWCFAGGPIEARGCMSAGLSCNENHLCNTSTDSIRPSLLFCDCVGSL